MIILDTNVLSETLKPKPSEAILRWLDLQEPVTTFTTAITQAEVLYSIELLPAGKRKTHLSIAIHQIFVEEFDHRILSFDGDAAEDYARIVANRESAGHPISQFDAMIAAIARSHQAVLATRNTVDFEDCGIEVINPWTH